MRSICFFNKFKSWGGGEKWHYEACNFFLNEGYNVSLIGHRNGKLIEKFEMNKKIKIKKVSGRKYAYLNIITILKLVFFLKKNKIDVLVFNSEEDVRLGSFPAKLAKVKVQVYRSGMPNYIKNQNMKKIFEENIDKVFTNSFEGKEIMEEKNEFLIGKIGIVKNGVALKKKETQSFCDETIFLGNAARFDEQKDQQTILKALKLLKESNVKFKFLIAGTGELEKQLKKMTEKFDLDEVEFLGFLDDTTELYKKIDIFILSSIFEGSSNALIESMSFGNSVIVSNIKSNLEIIGDDKYGISYKVGDSKDLFHKLYELINDKEKLKSMKEKAYMRVKEEYNYYNNMKIFERDLEKIYVQKSPSLTGSDYK